MIKKNKIAYNSLNKDSILTMITNFEKNSKYAKPENLLSKKTQRKKAKLAKENIHRSNTHRKAISLEGGHSLRTRGNYRSSMNIMNVNSPLYSTNISTKKRRSVGQTLASLSNSRNYLII
jgi:hypothetical protein